MRRSNRGKSRSLHFYITRVFIILSAVNILLAVFLLAAYQYIEQYARPQTAGEQISRNLSSLQREKYTKLKLKSYFGKGGYYEITDENARILYTSRPSEKNTYSKVVLNYIPDVDKDTYLSATPFDDQYGRGYIIVRIQTEKSYDRLKELIVLNGKRQVRYSNLKDSRDSFTQKELTYMLEASDRNDTDDYILQKYVFTVSDGSKRCLLLHAPVGNQSSARFIYRWKVVSILIFAASVLISLILAGILITRKIRRPLRILGDAMDNFSEGKSGKVSEKTSVLEFDNVLRIFNHMQKRLTESELQRKELEKQRRKMLADISHDLNTPITVISGYIDAMKDGLIPQEEIPKYLDIMSRKTELMGGLIRSFSEYSRLEHPDFKFVLEKGDLAEYLREYMAAKYEELDLGGYSVEIDIPEKPVPARFDAAQLKRAFENIISNALKYTGPGTTIYTQLSVPDSSCARIRIGDNGPGMSEDLKASAFEPFMIGDMARKSGMGTGLGLSIAKKIVEGHHGTIRILSKEEWQQGTMYEIRIPVGMY